MSTPDDQMWQPLRALGERVDGVGQMLGIHAEETRTRLDLLTEKVLNAIGHWDGKLDDVADLVRGVARSVADIDRRVADVENRLALAEQRNEQTERVLASLVKRRPSARKKK